MNIVWGMRNVTGNPVRQADFHDREAALEQLWRLLEADSVLMLAPRRVGKTSVLWKLREQAEQHERHAAFVSVAGLLTEWEVIQSLFQALQKLDAGRRVLDSVARGPIGRFLRRIQKVDVGGLAGFELAPASADWREVAEAIVDAAQAHGNWLLLVDELPVFVLTLLRQDPSGERARRFLETFRRLRQSAPDLRWVLAGSIGLDAVVARLSATATINDLALFEGLGPLEPHDADGLLESLAASHGVPLEKDVPAHVRERLGWLIPYHVQLLFSEIRSKYRPGQPPVDRQLVDQAREDLLAPAKRAYFEPWKQRLREVLGPPDDSHAEALLDALSHRDKGLEVSHLCSAVLARHIADPAARENSLAYLLRVLEGDGYLVRQGQTYRFRSPLLRDYWKWSAAS